MKKLNIFIYFVMYVVAISLVLPPGSDSDSNFHWATILCEKKSLKLCSTTSNEESLIPSKFIPNLCYWEKYRKNDPNCKIYNQEKIKVPINNGLYKNNYYSVMAHLIPESHPLFGILIIRIINGFILISVSFLILKFVGIKAFKSFVFVHLFMSIVWGSQFYFTHNPSVWTIISFTAIPFFIFSVADKSSLTLRLFNISIIIFLLTLLYFSRPDYYLYFIILVVGSIIYYRKFINPFIMITLSTTLLLFIFINFKDKIELIYKSFKSLESYKNFYLTSNFDILLHNVSLFPFFILGQFNLMNNSEDFIARINFSIIFLIFLLLILQNILNKWSKILFAICLSLFTVACLMVFTALNYLVVYDNNIAYRYFTPIFVALIIYIIYFNKLQQDKSFSRYFILILSFTHTYYLLVLNTQYSTGYLKAIKPSLDLYFLNINLNLLVIVYIIISISFYKLIKTTLDHSL